MVTLADAARELHVNYATLHKWATTSGMDMTRVGHYWMASLDDFKNLVDRKRKEGEERAALAGFRH